ncbi:MAG: pentapeptide repeat-containing protein [Cyanobacteria bacterium J06626_18]
MTQLSPTQQAQTSQDAHPDLPFEDRLYVIKTVSALPLRQFEQLITVLNPPADVMPPKAASRSQRSKALLDWVEGPMGPGLALIDEELQALVPGATAPKAIVFANDTADLAGIKLAAIMRQVKQKTEDDSLTLAFYTTGHIKLVLNGSPEGLEKLQALFDSGELLNASGGSAVELVCSIASDTLDARKARLIQALTLEVQHVKSTHTTALAIVSALNRVQDCNRIRNVLKIFDQAGTQALKIDQAHNRVSARTLARTLNRARDRVLERAHNLNLDIDHNHISDVIDALDQDRFGDALDALDRALDREQALTRRIVNAVDIARDLDIARNLALNLTRVFSRSSILSLVGINLRGANLNGLNLVGIDLTGTDLTDAMVKDTVFGNNSGLAEADKAALQQRGAIFRGPPGSLQSPRR